MGPFLNRESDDDNDDNDDDSDDSDENLEEWLNNSGTISCTVNFLYLRCYFRIYIGASCNLLLYFLFVGSDDEEINIFNIDVDGGKFGLLFFIANIRLITFEIKFIVLILEDDGPGNNEADESAQWTTTDDEDGHD